MSLRVLIISNLYPMPGQPGRAPYNRDQFGALASAGVEARLIVPVPWNEPALRRGPVPVAEGPPADYPRYWYPPGGWRRSYGACLARSIAGRARKILKDFRPEVILGSWAYPDGWAAVRLARKRQLPAVLKVHGSDIHQLPRYPARRPGTVEALDGADRVVAVSRDLAARVAELGVDAGKVVVVRNGVDRDRFGPGDRDRARLELGIDPAEPLVLAVGNLVDVKGFDVLIDAMAEPELSGARLALVGSGPLQGALQAQAAARGVGDRLRFAGRRPHAELPSWLRAADVLALPSRDEGIPNALLEASACGLPWVASAVGGIGEIVAAPGHRTVPPGDPGALAKALAASLARPRSQGMGPPPPSWGESAGALADVLRAAARAST